MANFLGNVGEKMEVLTRNKKDKPNYIVRVTDGDTLHVKFADGTVYDDYENSKANEDLFNDVMEKQVEEGIKNIGTFKSLLGVDIAASLISATATVATVAGTNILESAPEEVKIGTIITGGIIALGTAIRANINNRKVKEIKKFQKRNEMSEDLANLEIYPHALIGLRGRIVSLVKSTPNPFVAINSEEYTEKDLEKIKKNIERDKVFQKAPIKRWQN